MGKHGIEDSNIDLGPAIVVGEDDVGCLGKEREKAHGQQERTHRVCKALKKCGFSDSERTESERRRQVFIQHEDLR